MICPLLLTCKKTVDLDTYRNVCANVAKDEYKNCDEYKKMASAPRKPAEWTTVLALPSA